MITDLYSVHPKHLTLCGSFGWGHAREAALAAAISDLAQSEGYSVTLHLLGAKKAGGLNAVIGLGEEDRERREGLRGHPVLICGQGVIESSTTALVLRCSSYLKPPFAPWAALFGASVELGISFPWLMRWRLRSLLRRMRKLFVADVGSESLVYSIVGKGPIQVIGDPCLSLLAEGEVAPEVAHLTRYLIVAVSPHWADSADWRRFIVRRLIELAERLDVAIVFMPTSISREDDRKEADAISKAMICENDQVRIVCINRLLAPKEMAKTLGQAVLVLAMRLHPCVMAYGQRTPFLALLQDPKLYSFARTVDCMHNLYPSLDLHTRGSHPYGYHFKDLPMTEGSLTQAALNAVKRTSFSALERLKTLQRTALRELMDGAAHS